jgi:hypothetical protein
MNLSERCPLKTHGVPPGRGQLGSSHEQPPRAMARRSGVLDNFSGRDALAVLANVWREGSVI